MIYKKYVIPFFLSCSSFVCALTSEWILDNNGNWAVATSANWSAGVPDAVDNVAEFLGAITANRMIALSQATTVGATTFNNANVYTISANTLTYRTSSGNAQINIPAGTGNHLISSAVSIASPLVIDHNVASHFTLSGILSGSQPLTIIGNNGQVILSGTTANTYSGPTIVNTSLPAAGLTLQKTGVTAIPGDVLISSGTLTMGAANQFGNNTAVTIDGIDAIFALGTFNQSVGHLNYRKGALTSLGGNLTLSGSQVALTLGLNTVVHPDLIFAGSGAIVVTPNVGSLSQISGNVNLGSSLHEVNISESDKLIIQGVVSGVEGGFVKTGSGVFELGGAADNTYTGATIINKGELQLNQPGLTAVVGNVLINGGTCSLLSNEQITNHTTMILQSGTFNMGGFNETIDRLDFIGGTVNHFTGTLALQSPSTALQMSGGTSLIGGTVFVVNGTGGVNFDSSNNGTATIGNLNLAAGTHPFFIANGSVTPDMQVTGILGGSGDIQKTGEGSLELSGTASNTFTGTTTVNGGILRLNKTGGAFAVPAVAANITIDAGALELLGPEQIAGNKTITMNNGTFFLNGMNQSLETLSYLGGSVTQSGGVLTLTDGTDALTMGSTVINGGVVISNGGPITFTGASEGAVMNGTLTLAVQNSFNINNGAAPYDMVINSQITGAGGITKTGAGTLVLRGSNHYTAQTIINQGTLQGNSISLPAVSTTITNPGMLIFDQTFDGTFLGTLGGNGDMIKQGRGTLIFSTPQIIDGTTIIAGGTLLVNNTFGSSTGVLTVRSGATLGGVGTINKNVTVNGTLAPGDHRIGTLMLNGAQIFNSGSMLDTKLTSTTNDLCEITGTLEIRPGSIFRFFPQPAVYIEPLNYTVIETTAGRTGTFDYISDFFPLFSGNLSYDTNHVYLSVFLHPINALQGLDSHAEKVAYCLDTLNPLPGSDLYHVINSLRLVKTVESIEKSLLDMQPSLFTSLVTVKQASSLYVRNALFNRLDFRIRSCKEEEKKYSYWAAPLISLAQENNHGKEAGYNVLTPGIIVGVDGRVAPQFQIGGGLGYTNADITWKKKRGTGRVQGMYGAVYGCFESQVGFLESAVLLGYDRYLTQRDIHISGLMPLRRHAKSDHCGLAGSVHMKGTFQFFVNNAQLGSYVSIDYLYQYESSFDEHGANSLNLNVSSKHANFFQSKIGTDFTRCFSLERKTLVPYIKINGIWEKRMNGGKEKSFFNGHPIHVQGYYRSRFLVGAEGGFDVKHKLKTAPKTSFNYKGKYGLGYQDHTFNFILIY